MYEENDVVILGGGIGALTVALYLLRSNVNPIIIAPDLGGKLLEVDLIQNFVGRYNAKGTEIFEDIEKQLEQAGFDIDKHYIPARVSNLQRYRHSAWEIIAKHEYTEEDIKIFGKNVVVATGQRNLHLTNIQKDIQKQCVLCDGFLYKDKEVVVIGGGDSAFTESLELAKICKKVKLCVRGGRIKAEKILVERVKNTDNIEYVEYSQSLDSVVETSDDRLMFKFNDKTLVADGMFVYIGHKPNNQFMPSYFNMKAPSGQLVTNTKQQAYANGRPVDNLYVVGDISNTEANQFGIAVGQGTIVATELLKKL